MNITAEVIRGIIILVLGSCLVLGFIFYTVKKAEDPARMVFKWVFTFIMLGVMFGIVGPIVSRGDQASAFVGIPATGACGIVFAIIWRHSICALFAKPFTSLYDGGAAEIDPHPAYSVALARQKRGRYVEAIAEIRRQLDRFPADVEGQLLLAQIQAEDLQDLDAAQITIQRFCAQPGHAPKNVAFALYSMADWHLSVAQDREAAQRNLQQIVDLFPDSEFALGASQRIAHLATNERMTQLREPDTYRLNPGERRLGLVKDTEPLRPVEIDPGKIAADYLAQLELHPLDWEAREKLALIYANHFQRLDLAFDQLEQVIQTPNQPAKNIVRCLNLMADLQVHGGAPLEAAQQTLQRIIDAGPDLAAAEVARNRLSLLKLEFKGTETKPAVKMGTYEQNIGLKSARKPK